jgi:hypothetical protein
MRRSTPCLLLLILALLPCAASAQTAQAPKAQRPEGNPPPPLFPKHRRGFYINNDNVEVIDATPQSPPLKTDDPGVPDKGEYEINLLTEADLGTDARSVNVLAVDANYGVVLKGWGHELPAQLKFEVPIAAASEAGNPYQVGLGNSALGVKLNFYNDESRGLSVSVYPQMEFSTASGVEKGVAEPGQTFILPLLISHESKYLTLVGNAGFSKAIHGAGRDTMAQLSMSMGRAFYPKLAVMGEIYSSSATNFRDDRLVSANAGIIYGVRKSIWYARIGHSLFSDDGPHTFLAFGMKVLFDTEHKSGAQP